MFAIPVDRGIHGPIEARAFIDFKMIARHADQLLGFARPPKGFENRRHWGDTVIIGDNDQQAARCEAMGPKFRFIAAHMFERTERDGIRPALELFCIKEPVCCRAGKERCSIF